MIKLKLPIMKASEKAFELIKQFEGLRLTAYKAVNSERYYTIGYGHCSALVTKGMMITLSEAENILKKDVFHIETQLNDLKLDFTQNQYDALVSFIYNIGWCHFRYSMTYHTLVDMVLRPSEVSPEMFARRMTLWVRCGDKVLKGLQKRRCAEANYFLGYKKFTLTEKGIEEGWLETE